MLKVRIISIPPGGAPEEIKKQWIGVEIPLSKYQPKTQDDLVRGTYDVAGDEKPPEDQVRNGFVVDTIDAIEALDKAGKNEAADWWREWVEINGIFLTMQLVFSPTCGELVED